MSLPVDALLPDILACTRQGGLVLEAATGAGKTTRVPPALLDEIEGEIWVLEPRRVAARAAATQVARSLGERPGETVGWSVRLDTRIGPRTRLIYATTGVFLRKLQEDPLLDGIGAVIFDEIHERSLDVDTALAMTRRVRLEVREDLCLVAMSATLDAERIADWLALPRLSSEGRLFPVEEHYLDQPPAPETRAWELAALGVRRALVETTGDVLCFLPGVGEIRRTHAALSDLDVQIDELYGDLPPEAQDRVLRRASRRKVVLATNVAETSVTIEGIEAVVDTGLSRVLVHDPNTGLDHLELGPISRASADQRRGRAGRLGPGWCLRLWTRASHQRREAHTRPEIERVALAGVVLELLAWGETDLDAFPWLEPPPAPALARAFELLELLGATEGGAITAIGRVLAGWPLQPRLARLLLEARRWGQAELGAWAAVLLAERDPFPQQGAAHVSGSDLLDRIESLTGNGPLPRPPRPVREHLSRLHQQLVRSARGPTEAHLPPDEALGRALVAAFPDRVARRRGPADRRAVTRSGLGVVLSPHSAVREGELFVALDGRGGHGADNQVRRAHTVQRDWLGGVRRDLEVRWDADRGRVRTVEVEHWGALVLDERPAKRPPADQASDLFARVLTEDPTRWPLQDEDLAPWLTRVRCLATWRPELALPALDEAWFQEHAHSLVHGWSALSQLTGRALADRLQSWLDHRQRAALDTLAPERLTVPSGSSLRLRYELGRPPVLAVRIQELYGWRETPRLGSGVAVRLELLAPNQRVQQITDDLAGFWERTYPEIRKELRARYPKHAWPEDPLTAQAEHRPRRKRR